MRPSTLAVAISLLALVVGICFAPELVGEDKTQSMFDAWSIVHAGAGIIFGISLSLASLVMVKVLRGKVSELPDKIYELPGKFFYGFLTVVVSSWELFEWFMENHGSLVGIYHFELSGVEHWTNRFIADPLCFLAFAVFVRWTARFLRSRS